ncbi:MAG: 4-(cytidine 5'-diphospho)-2-C-methyl-D-erythritol kinase [Pirellulaceae bacterium]|nr:4-(cytidine 5'-diphospho)-2-C-methyl-D-erythritol kinase [Pirellulaceae bacterium]
MIRRFSPAKLNLLLRVGSRLPSGYHQLETVMLPVSLGDWLAVVQKPQGVTLEVHERFDFSGHVDAVSKIPTDEQNLIVRIAVGFLKHCGVSAGVHFVLQKSIPAGGGLGGASSNAAATLLLLNELFDLGWTWKQLAAFSAHYGSDIAFFTQPQAAACSGRGEIVEPFEVSNSVWFTIVRPPFGLGTPAVFAELASDRSKTGAAASDLLEINEKKELASSLKIGTIGWAAMAGNDLQPAAVRLRPDLEIVSACCGRSYPLTHLMTGSGSCWFAAFRHRRQAVWAANRLRGQNVGRVDVVRPVAVTPMGGN